MTPNAVMATVPATVLVVPILVIPVPVVLVTVALIRMIVQPICETHAAEGAAALVRMIVQPVREAHAHDGAVQADVAIAHMQPGRDTSGRGFLGPEIDDAENHGGENRDDDDEPARHGAPIPRFALHAERTPR